jgi:hypothetical protein
MAFRVLGLLNVNYNNNGGTLGRIWWLMWEGGGTGPLGALARQVFEEAGWVDVGDIRNEVAFGWEARSDKARHRTRARGRLGARGRVGGGAEVAEEGLDVVRGGVGVLEDVQDELGAVAGEEGADLVAVSLDVGEFVLGEEVAVADQEEMGLG